MKAVSVNQLKKELVNCTQDELVELCLRLSKFKKENKELLTYLLFESSDEIGYIETDCKDLEPVKGDPPGSKGCKVFKV